MAEIGYDLTPKRRDRSGLERILDSLPKEAEIRLLKDCCTVMTGRSIRSSALQDHRPNSAIPAEHGRTDAPSSDELEERMRELAVEIYESDDGKHIGNETARNNPRLDEMKEELADVSARYFSGGSELPTVPYIRIRDIEKGAATRGALWIKPLQAVLLQREWKLRAGDILLSKSGTIGKVGIVRNGAVGGVAANGFFVIRVKEGTIDPHYLLAYLQSTEATAWLEDRARGAAAKHLSMASIKELPVALPPLQMQQRTAEQNRKFGVDALTYLAELLTEDDSDSLASELNDWVSLNLKRVESYEGDAASQNVLQLLEEVAGSRCPINTCKECKHPYYLDYETSYLEPPMNYSEGIATYCLECWLGLDPSGEHVDCFEDETPIGPWAVEFRSATKPLAGVSSIPDATALVSVLQRVTSNMRETVTLIDGNLPNQERARLLTGRVVNLISRYTQALLEDAKLAINVVAATEDHFGAIEIRLEIENRGRVPIREVRFSMHPPMDEVEPQVIKFLPPGQAYEVHFEGQNQRRSDDIRTSEMWSNPAWSLIWTAYDLAGDTVEGKCDLGIDLEQKPPEGMSVRETLTEPLRNSPYVTGNAVRTDRNDLFIGRDDLLDDIRHVIGHSGNVVLLEGNRRAGKSSILWHLEGCESIPGWLGVYISFQGTEGDSEEKAKGVPTVEVFRTIALETAKTIQRVVGIVVAPNGSELGRRDPQVVDLVRESIKVDAPFTYFREYIALVLDWLQSRDLRLLLLLDEFDKLQEGIDSGITSPQVPENLRFLLQSNSRLTAILTSMKRLRRLREEYFSVLYGLGTPFDVTSLSKEDAETLVTSPVKGQLVYAPQAIARAVYLVARQPYLLQCLCESIFCNAKASGVRSITVDHVNEAATDVLKTRHFNDLFRYAGTERRRFILALCHREAQGPDRLRLPVIREKLSAHGIEVSEEDLTTDLEWLTDLELLDFSGANSGEFYSLTVPLMGLWIDTLDYTGLMSKARVESADVEEAVDE
ncbi:MAG TPA: restriction endonuclease subunit S [Pirellulaceae bacterium]|nr:restriction endonuclease subunit S [Pirellulaceae bacterium]